MGRGMLAVWILVVVACGRGPNSLNGPLAFPVDSEFATVGLGVAIPALPGATGIYLLDQTYAADACGSYFFGDNGGTTELAQVVIGISVSDGGTVVPGTIAVQGRNDAGAEFAQISYFNPAAVDAGWAFGIGGQVTITGASDAISGSFQTTVAGTSLTGNFSVVVCNPLALDGGSNSL